MEINTTASYTRGNADILHKLSNSSNWTRTSVQRRNCEQKRATHCRTFPTQVIKNERNNAEHLLLNAFFVKNVETSIHTQGRSRLFRNVQCKLTSGMPAAQRSLAQRQTYCSRSKFNQKKCDLELFNFCDHSCILIINNNKLVISSGIKFLSTFSFRVQPLATGAGLLELTHWGMAETTAESFISAQKTRQVSMFLVLAVFCTCYHTMGRCKRVKSQNDSKGLRLKQIRGPPSGR